MNEPDVPAGHVRALIERPHNEVLEEAARALLAGRDASTIMHAYFGIAAEAGFRLDPTFGAIPIGGGAESALPRTRQEAKAFFDPGNKVTRFLVHGFVEASREGVPEYLVEKDGKYPIHSNPLVGGLWTLPPRPPTPPRPCLPTCGTSERVGDTRTVRIKLDAQTLSTKGLDGTGVAIAIVDSGIFAPRIEKLLGDALELKTPFTLDKLSSWKPRDLVTEPGEKPFAELFVLQERIATRIVWSLAPHVRESELKRGLRKRPENMNAYDLLLQAIDLQYRMNPADFARAGNLLRQSIKADDSYATAHAYAALWQIHNINQGWTRNLEADSLDAERLAAAAVDRDPADGFALAIHAHTKAVLFRDYNSSFELFDRALQAAPGNAMVWVLSSGVHSYTGQAKSAIERAEKGMRLSPLDTQSFFYLLFLTLAHYVNGTYDEAIIWGRKSAGMNPRLCSNLRWLIGSHVALGQIEEARYYARTILDVSPGFRLSQYSKWSPLREDLREELVKRLQIAGIPE